jgi:heme exporter protein B
MNAFGALVARDLRLAARQGGAATMAVSFFVVAVALFPLGVGPDLPLLGRIGPAVIWVAALLATLLTLDRLFQADLEDGSLDLLALGPLPLGFVVLAKCLAHWLTGALPLLAVAPVLCLLMNVPGHAVPVLLAAMALGTPALSLIGAIGAALTVGIRRGGVLLSLLVLPLYVPVLIFGVGAVDAATAGLPIGPSLSVLAAGSLVALVLAPLAAAAALRLALE